MTKLNVNLGIVQETMLFPLVGRALASQMRSPIINDHQAVEIVNQLDYDINKVKRRLTQGGQIAMAARAYKMDNAIKDFIKVHPAATIVNIGAGLDTAFSRVDNGTIKWFDLDLPDSIDLRKQIIPEQERSKCISKSMLDFSWILDIGDTSKGLFIQVPGVFPYFEEADVKDFFVNVAPKLPNAEIIFDVASLIGKYIVYYGAIRGAGMNKAKLKWSITDANIMKKWSPHIEVVNQEPYMRDLERKWHYWPTTNIAMNWNDRLKIGQFFHLRFV